MPIFPEKPRLEGFYQTILWEPMVNSGERIAAATLISTQDGNQYTVQPFLTEKRLISLFGKSAGAKAYSQIEWLIESAEKHLKSKQSISLDGWQPPFEGVAILPKTNALGDQIEDFFEQARRVHSAFCERPTR